MHRKQKSSVGWFINLGFTNHLADHCFPIIGFPFPMALVDEKNALSPPLAEEWHHGMALASGFLASCSGFWGLSYSAGQLSSSKPPGCASGGFHLGAIP